MIIAGDGDIENWKNLAIDHNISELVEFRGWINGNEKIYLYLGCTIFCLPSHFESFGISALEAMHARKPLICTNLGGFTDLITHGENGFLVPPKSPYELAKCIKILIQDPDLALKMGECGFKKATKYFTTEKNMKKTIECYNRVLFK